MTEQSERATEWRDLGRGTGKRPDGVRDDDVVRVRYGSAGQWTQRLASDCMWLMLHEYQLLVRPAADSDALRGALQAMRDALNGDGGENERLIRAGLAFAAALPAATPQDYSEHAKRQVVNGVSYCRRGHAMTTENTYQSKNMYPRCKECNRINARKTKAAYNV